MRFVFKVAYGSFGIALLTP
ncbi:hypothetical protein CGH62_27495 [Vibrio parahaemolyticus]|nr:hypothetical protein CGH62_27495 [Vibrio parahaemolyticus]